MFFWILCALISQWSIALPALQEGDQTAYPAVAIHAMVSTQEALATQVGVEILKTPLMLPLLLVLL